MSLYIIVLFFMTSIGISVSPGPVMLFSFHNGVNYGMRVAFFGILGSGLGCGVLISLVALFLDLLLKIFPDLFFYIQWFGVMYLCYLAFHLWNASPVSFEKRRHDYRSEASENINLKSFYRAFIVAVANPKGVLFFSVFFPQFIHPDYPYIYQYLVLTMLFVPVDMCVALCYAYGGSYAARVLDERGLRILNRCSAAVMLLLAVLMAFARTGTSSII